MNKEEYIERHEALKKQIEELNAEYIKTNDTRFPVGTRVRVTGKNGKSRDGEVVGYTIDYDTVVPIVRQLTKEGNVSLRRIVLYVGDTIETL